MPDLVMDISNAFPVAPPLEEMIKTPRASRKLVQLEGWKMTVSANLTPELAKTPGEFNGLMEKFENDGDRGSRGFTSPDSSGGPSPNMLLGPNRRRSTAGNVKKMKGQGQVAENPGEAQRGYILTIRCRTPNANAADLVNDTVVKALKARNQAAPNPPRNYAIVRVERAEVRKVTPQDRPAQAVRTMSSRRRLVLPGLGGRGMPPGPSGAPRPGVPFNPLDPTQQPMQAEPAKTDPWEDPLVPGESTQNDMIVTLVAAVVLDPKPLPPPPNPNQVAANQ